MKLLMMLLLSVSFVACNVSKDTLKKTLEENPDILANAIKKNPVPFMEAVREAAQIAQEADKKKKAEEEQKKLQETYDNPLEAVIRSDENISSIDFVKLTMKASA